MDKNGTACAYVGDYPANENPEGIPFHVLGVAYQSIKDIQLIDKAQILSIQMYMPEMDDYNELVSKARLANEKIVCVFKISTKPGTTLPPKFAKGKK